MTEQTSTPSSNNNNNNNNDDDWLVFSTIDIILSILILFFLTWALYICYRNNQDQQRQQQLLAALLREQERKRRRPPVLLTKEELRKYNGSDASLPLYVGVRGQIFDVGTRSDLYGAGAGYNCFAGFDASRALAKTSTLPQDVENSDLTGLTLCELDTLAQWEMTFDKYDKVGWIVSGEEERQKRMETWKEAQAEMDKKSQARKQA